MSFVPGRLLVVGGWTKLAPPGLIRLWCSGGCADSKTRGSPRSPRGVLGGMVVDMAGEEDAKVLVVWRSMGSAARLAGGLDSLLFPEDSMRLSVGEGLCASCGTRCFRYSFVRKLASAALPLFLVRAGSRGAPAA